MCWGPLWEVPQVQGSEELKQEVEVWLERQTDDLDNDHTDQHKNIHKLA